MNLKDKIIKPDDTLRAALDVLRSSGAGVVLFEDEQGRYAGMLSDAQMRQLLLTQPELDQPSRHFIQGQDISVPQGCDNAQALEIMRAREVSCVPVTGSSGGVAALLWRKDIDPDYLAKPQMNALLMAGGFGKRLYPLTNDVPKPMLRIGSKPMLEHIILKIKAYGVENITISTHHMPEKITDYFGDGSKLGVNINYVHEDSPLGTGGALGLLQDTSKPLLMMNGDILTGLNVRAFYDFHVENGCDISVAARPYEHQVPYGVIDIDDAGAVKRIVEKPVQKHLISGGVYILSPSVYGDIEQGRVFDLPDLVEEKIQEGRDVRTFLMWEYWLDIGMRAEYDLAQTFISHKEAAG